MGTNGASSGFAAVAMGRAVPFLVALMVVLMAVTVPPVPKPAVAVCDPAKFRFANKRSASS